MFIRLLKYAIKNILRNKFLSISSLLVLTLLIFFINILLVIHSVSFKIIDSINSKLTISLYLNEKYDKNSIEVIDLMNDIKGIWNIELEYRSKENVLEDLRGSDPDLVKILERANPLPNTISLSNIALEEYSLLNNTIENKLYVLSQYNNDKLHFSNYTSQYEKINKIIWVLNTLQIGLYIIIIIFLVSISIIVYSIIWNFVYYYKDEIYITRLVWWSKSFIYGPFVFQWIIYCFISFLFSFFIFLFIVKNVNYIFPELYLYSFKFLLNNYLIFFLEIIIFSFIWAISWYFSSKKYLK